jgi:hypothetical protein
MRVPLAARTRPGVEDHVVDKHEDAVEVVEGVHVDALCGIPVGVDIHYLIPHLLVRRYALNKGKGYAGDSECGGDEVHYVDTDARPMVDGQCGVQQEERVLDSPIAEEVEDSRWYSQLEKLEVSSETRLSGQLPSKALLSQQL